jgi:hypothetical protein
VALQLERDRSVIGERRVAALHASVPLDVIAKQPGRLLVADGGEVAERLGLQRREEALDDGVVPAAPFRLMIARMAALASALR